MTRNVKALGLALVAVFAMSAVVAQGAAAVDHTFTSNAAKTFLTATQEGNHVLKGGELESICKKASFTGEQSGETADKVSVKPSYSECEVPGLGGVTVVNSGCSYEFDSDTTTNPANTTAGESGIVNLKCTAGASITIDGPGCDIIFGEKHGANVVNQELHGVKYKDDAENANAITVEAHNFGIKYTTTGAFCFLIGKANGGTYSDGTYLGNATVTGFKNAGHTEVANLGITTP